MVQPKNVKATKCPTAICPDRKMSDRKMSHLNRKMSQLNRKMSDRKVSRPQDVIPQIANPQKVQPQPADREMRYYPRDSKNDVCF